jgi:hypothetical protein
LIFSTRHAEENMTEGSSRPSDGVVGVVERALERIIAEGASSRAPGLTGYSGEKVVGLLQQIAGDLAEPGVCYLEVGVYQGLTLLSVAHAAEALTVFGIDDFSQFDPQGHNRGIVERRRRQLALDNVRLINLDYEEALADLGSHIGARRVVVYFIDGPHDYRSQLLCLELALPYLANKCVVVVDDCNYEHVRQANADFLTIHPDFALMYEVYTEAHPTNMSAAQRAAAEAGWWNGINVLVRDSDAILERILPPTSRDRSLFLNDHIVHSERAAHLAPEATALADAIRSYNPIRALGHAFRIARGTGGGLHRHRNAGCTGGWSRLARRVEPGN